MANAEATSVDGSQERDILPEPACRELCDGTKVNQVFIARTLTFLWVMMDFGQGFPLGDPFKNLLSGGPTLVESILSPQSCQPLLQV